MKKPPYSRLQAGRAKLPYSWWVLIGSDAWDKARIWVDVGHRIFTVCPPSENPASFDWSAYRVSPQPVGLVRCGDVVGNQVQKLVRVMLRAGSLRIYDLLSDAVYIKSKEAA